MISDRFWREIIGGGTDVIGRTIQLNGKARQVVGVMPAGFAYPYPDVDVWLTMGWDPSDRAQVGFRRAHYIRTIARVKAGVSINAANAQLQAVVRRLQQQYPVTNTGMGASMHAACTTSSPVTRGVR